MDNISNPEKHETKKHNNENPVISDVTTEASVYTNDTGYKDLFDSVTDAIYIHNEDGTIVDINLGALKIYGYDKDEVIGNNPEMLSAPGKNDIKLLINYVKDAFNGIPKKFEFWGKRKNGEIFPKEVILNRGTYFGKKVVIATARDISERKKYEEKIQLNEMRLETMLQLNKMNSSSNKEISKFALEQSVKITSSKYGYLSFLNADETVLEMYSWSDDTFKDCKIEDMKFIYEVKSTGLWGDAIRHRRPIITNDYENEKLPGRTYPEGHVPITRHLGVPVFGGDKIVALIGVGNKQEPYDDSDIKQLTLFMNAVLELLSRKKTEEELYNIHLRLITLFKNISDVAMYETGGKDEFITENIQKMLGYPVERFLYNKDFFNSIIHPTFRNNIGNKIKLWYEKENNYNENLKLEYPCKRSDDSYIWIQNNMAKAKSGENNYILGIIENIDERKKNEDKLTKLNEELKDLNINKDKFFSIIAHDLRGPFNNLLGFSKVLQDDLDILSKDEMREYSGYVYTSARNVYDLVENLLQWSRIQTGRMEYQPIKIDLYEEIFKITELFRSNAIAKKINLINEVNNNLFVFADQNMLHSVLQNLLSNAIKFTNSAGNIILKAESFDDFIEVSITDTGVGIKKDDIKKLFRIDIQFTNPGTENEEGTGLGLILCKELIEKNKGVISVESIYGKGSKFTFTIPKWTNKYFQSYKDTLNG